LILPFACGEYSQLGLRINVKAIGYGALFWLGLVVPVSAGYDEGRSAYAHSDYVTAFHEWLAVGLNGHQEAQYSLGVLYSAGLGVPQDHGLAAKWFQMAAERGLPAAQMRLGELYQEGKGVPKDSQEAYLWFTLASAKFGPGEQREEAISRQESVSASLTRAQITQVLDRALVWKPLNQGIKEPQASNLIAVPEQEIVETVDGVESHDQDPEATAPVARIFEPTDTDAEGMTLEPTAGTDSTGSLDLEAVATAKIPERESFAVHLASLRTQDRAEAEWHRLQSEFPKLLHQRDLVIRFVELEDLGAFYRVLTGPFHDQRKAQDLCAEFASRQQYCLVTQLADDRTD
jgi:hypothetical protein